MFNTTRLAEVGAMFSAACGAGSATGAPTVAWAGVDVVVEVVEVVEAQPVTNAMAASAAVVKIRIVTP
jgi:hypothetical protein